MRCETWVRPCDVVRRSRCSLSAVSEIRRDTNRSLRRVRCYLRGPRSGKVLAAHPLSVLLGAHRATHPRCATMCREAPHLEIRGHVVERQVSTESRSAQSSVKFIQQLGRDDRDDGSGPDKVDDCARHPVRRDHRGDEDVRSDDRTFECRRLRARALGAERHLFSDGDPHRLVVLAGAAGAGSVEDGAEPVRPELEAHGLGDDLRPATTCRGNGTVDEREKLID
jgi:hypothetical protein